MTKHYMTAFSFHISGREGGGGLSPGGCGMECDSVATNELINNVSKLCYHVSGGGG